MAKKIKSRLCLVCKRKMFTIPMPAYSENEHVHKCQCKEGRNKQMIVERQKAFFTKHDGIS